MRGFKSSGSAQRFLSTSRRHLQHLQCPTSSSRRRRVISFAASSCGPESKSSARNSATQRPSALTLIPRSPAICRCLRPLVCKRRTASSLKARSNRRPLFPFCFDICTSCDQNPIAGRLHFRHQGPLCLLQNPQSILRGELAPLRLGHDLRVRRWPRVAGSGPWGPRRDAPRPPGPERPSLAMSSILFLRSLVFTSTALQ